MILQVLFAIFFLSFQRLLTFYLISTNWIVSWDYTLCSRHMINRLGPWCGVIMRIGWSPVMMAVQLSTLIGHCFFFCCAVITFLEPCITRTVYLLCRYWQNNMNNVKVNKSAHKESVRDLRYLYKGFLL